MNKYPLEATVCDGRSIYIKDKIFLENLLNKFIYGFENNEKHLILKMFPGEMWKLAFDELENALKINEKDTLIFPDNSFLMIGREDDSLIEKYKLFRISSSLFNLLASFLKCHISYKDEFKIKDYLEYTYQNENTINKLHNEIIKYIGSIQIDKNLEEQLNQYEKSNIIYNDEYYFKIISGMEKDMGIFVSDNGDIIIYYKNSFVIISYDFEEYKNSTKLKLNQLSRLIKLCNVI